MEEDPSMLDDTVEGDPDSADTSAETEPAETEEEPAEPSGSETEELPGSETEEPPGSDPEAPVSEETEPDADKAAAKTPGVEPPKADERTGSDGIPQTTTTGDPDKDVRGPSVTEEARRRMEGDRALDEPGYGDLGHAEDFKVLRDD